MRSAPPRPDEAPAQRRTERRWLPALAVLAVIVAVTGGAQVVEAIAGAEAPVVVGTTVTVTPEPGWAVVSVTEGDPTSQALLSRGAANLLVVATPAGAGAVQELGRGYVQTLQDRFAQVRIGEAGVEGNRVARFGYVGVTGDGVAVEGVVALVADPVTGSGAIFDGFAPKGSLGAAIGDLRTMVETAEVG